MATRSGNCSAFERASFGNVSCTRATASAVKSRLRESLDWIESSDTSGGRESGVKFSQGPVTCQANRDVITVIYAAARRVVRLARAAEIYSGHGGGVHEALPAATFFF